MKYSALSALAVNEVSAMTPVVQPPGIAQPAPATGIQPAPAPETKGSYNIQDAHESSDEVEYASSQKQVFQQLQQGASYGSLDASVQQQLNEIALSGECLDATQGNKPLTILEMVCNQKCILTEYCGVQTPIVAITEWCQANQFQPATASFGFGATPPQNVGQIFQTIQDSCPGFNQELVTMFSEEAMSYAAHESEVNQLAGDENSSMSYHQKHTDSSMSSSTINGQTTEVSPGQTPPARTECQCSRLIPYNVDTGSVIPGLPAPAAPLPGAASPI